MADLQRQQQATDMTETTKPVSHNDDEAFMLMLRQFAKRAAAAGDEEMEFVISAAADRIALWKERCESVQADFERSIVSENKSEGWD